MVFVENGIFAASTRLLGLCVACAALMDLVSCLPRVVRSLVLGPQSVVYTSCTSLGVMEVGGSVSRFGWLARKVVRKKSFATTELSSRRVWGGCVQQWLDAPLAETAVEVKMQMPRPVCVTWRRLFWTRKRAADTIHPKRKRSPLKLCELGDF